MKQGYSTVIATSILAMAGVAQASADSYSVSINDSVVTPSKIEVGKPISSALALPTKRVTKHSLLEQVTRTKAMVFQIKHFSTLKRLEKK